MVKRFVGEIHVDDETLAKDVAKALENACCGYDIELYPAKVDLDRNSRKDYVSMKVFKFVDPGTES